MFSSADRGLMRCIKFPGHYNIWATSIHIDETVVDDFFKNNPNRFYMWATPKISGMLAYSDQFKRDMWLYPLVAWWKLFHKLKHRPSTGAMVVDFFANFISYSKLSIYGMDFYASNTLYGTRSIQETLRSAPHNFSKEKEYILSLAKHRGNIYFFPQMHSED